MFTRYSNKGSLFFSIEFSFKKLKLCYSRRFNKRMKWCGHCLRLCMVTCHGGFIFCSICGKILADWSTEQKRHKMLRRRKRRKTIRNR